MSIDLEYLEKLALEATPGPWFAENYETEPYGLTAVYNTFHNGDTMDRDLVAEVAYDNAEFIAATDPQTVLDLVARVREAEARIEKAEDYVTRHYLDTTVGERILAALTEGDEK